MSGIEGDLDDLYLGPCLRDDAAVLLQGLGKDIDLGSVVGVVADMLLGLVLELVDGRDQGLVAGFRLGLGGTVGPVATDAGGDGCDENSLQGLE